MKIDKEQYVMEERDRDANWIQARNYA